MYDKSAMETEVKSRLIQRWEKYYAEMGMMQKPHMLWVMARYICTF